ncbi:hypothetical protein [Aquipuribacter sp. SD81]|uniref:hypothetical protein n=1 Tax=Aquipuribacter sp. SD81 TaxID=3127703 RepID=UPI003017777E
MIDRLPARVVVVAAAAIVVSLGALGALSIGDVRSPALYALALALGLASSVSVVLRWPPERARAIATGVAVAVVAIGLLVVAVLPDDRPGYALWYPAFVWLPLSGLALRGHPRLALAAAVASAATTVGWAWQEPGVAPVQDGLYRVVSPTAVVVVAVGIHLLVQQNARAVERARAARAAAARARAASLAAAEERRQHLQQVEQIAVPVLRRLAEGDPVDARLATECRLLEAAVRDGIRGRHVVDPSVRDSVWAARSRGVEVVLLDDSGTEPGDDPPPIAQAVRRCLVELVEKVEAGVLTVRLSSPEDGTLVVVAPDAADLADRCRRTLQERGTGDAVVDVEPVERGSSEMVVTVSTALAPAPAGTRQAV